MNIVITEGNATNPGDLSYKIFETLGHLVVFPRTSNSELVKNIRTADAVIVNKVAMTKQVLDECPKLKYIGVMATGFNTVDIASCKEKGITVTNIPSYSTSAVAQHVFSFLLEFSNSVSLHDSSVHAGEWQRAEDFCYWKKPLIELQGKTFGIFGFGNIGSAVAKIANAFGMNVISKTRTPKKEVKCVSMEELFLQSDVISLHAPLDKDTEHIISKKYLDLAKKNLISINTARGGLIDENDVALALREGKIAGYACDVVEIEPIVATNPLLFAPNCIMTPHIAWAPFETRKRCLDIAYSNLLAWTQGKKQNVVA